jgi:hypothetical protein
MTNHPNRISINAMEAGAFVLHCELAGLSTADALAELAQTTWPDARDDSSLGRRRHTPTIRRLARPGLMELDARHAWSAAWQAAREADKARWIALPAAVKQEIREAAAEAGGNKSNKEARAVAVARGITTYSDSIDNLRSLIDPRQPWNI